MNKRVFGRKLSRSRPAREALFASLSRAMILDGKIVTTRAKAKAVVGEFEKLITLAKHTDLSSRRRALAFLDNAKDATAALFKLAPTFSARTSGYTRIISLPTRKGDNAKMVRIEWTDKTVVSDKPVVNSKKADKKEEAKKKVKVTTKKVIKKA